MSQNLMQGLLDEINRNRELLKAYEKIGPSGIFGATVIKALISKAEKAINENDVVKMIVAFRELKEAE